jgi:hypothetical protein
MVILHGIPSEKTFLRTLVDVVCAEYFALLVLFGFVGYEAESIEAFDDEDINMNQFLELNKFFLGQDDFDIKARALIQVGLKFSFFVSEVTLWLLCLGRLYNARTLH